MNYLADAVTLPLAPWQSFYAIVGASAGALIGLQFVVIALMADMPTKASGKEAINTFLSPTVAHFSGALAISAIMSAPWPSEFTTAVAIGLCGFFGLIYSAIVVGRARRQKTYKMALEDWIWQVTLPIIVYGSLFVSAPLARNDTKGALFIVAAGSLGLLFVGIRNAWDTVVYLVVIQRERKERERK